MQNIYHASYDGFSDNYDITHCSHSKYTSLGLVYLHELASVNFSFKTSHFYFFTFAI